MHVLKRPKDQLTHDIGYCFLNVVDSIIVKSIILQPFKNYNYYKKRLTRALNTGLITQQVFNLYNNPERINKVIHDISTIELEKSTLLDLIESKQIALELNGEASDILTILNENNYQIIAKL
ncbi:hypothetical protein AB832_08035 [Flavobacteriaceae bacterium (ex Bugula neritina AB1)]|nr:hypothetical protein AB832_08035 [Flavobacteriaceae bacterium (ex Bugula neritina AB1)]